MVLSHGEFFLSHSLIYVVSTFSRHTTFGGITYLTLPPLKKETVDVLSRHLKSIREKKQRVYKTSQHIMFYNYIFYMFALVKCSVNSQKLIKICCY